MFKKIVSRLPFSPSLIKELGSYAKKLRKEEALRKTGLILTVISLIIQSLIVLSPPESANAANSNDLVYGGIHTKRNLLDAWDQNRQGYRDLLKHAGITRKNLVNSVNTEIHSRKGGKSLGWLSWNRSARFGMQKGETSAKIGSQTIYIRPLASFDTGRNKRGTGSWYKAFVGKNSRGQEFAIMKGCANITLKYRPKSAPPVYSCNTLYTPKKLSRTKYSFNVKTSAHHGAKNKDYTYYFGDGSKKTVSGGAVVHNYSKPGTYQVKVVPRFVVGGKVVTKTSEACKRTVVVSPAPQPKKPGISIEKKVNNKKFLRVSDKEFTYSIKVKNTGKTVLNNVKVTDSQPKGIKFIRSSKGTIKNGKLTYNVGALGVGKTISFTITAKSIAESGKAVNTACVNTPSIAGENDDCDNATVEKPKRISVCDTKTKKIVTIDEDELTDSSRYKEEAACRPDPCPVNPSLLADDPACQPCPGDPTIWVKDEKCSAKIIRSKSAKNLTAKKDATSVKARASDRIEYKLTVKNEGKAAADFTISDNISDVLEYATMYDYGGGTVNEQKKILSWPKIKLAPGEEQSRIYVVQMASKISPMAQGTSDSTSYDCQMTNVFGNTLDVKVNCPAVKNVERVVEELPKTGPSENMIFGGIVAAIVTFLYLRSRQLNKEVRLIRKEVTSGTI